MNNDLIFSPKFKDEVFYHIKFYGIKRAFAFVVSRGIDEVYAGALIRNIIRVRGW